MAHLPKDDKAQLEPTTSCSIKGPVKIIIDWEIPDFSTRKKRRAEMESKVAVVGTSAWSIILFPLNDVKENLTADNEPVDVDADAGPSIGVYLKRECLGNDVSEVQAFFEFSIRDGAGRWHTILEKEDTPDTFEAVVSKWGDSCIQHADLWGPDPKYILKNDTLKIRAEIQYASVSRTELKDPVEPLRKKLATIRDSKVEKTFKLVSSEGTTFSVHRGVLSASSPVFCSMLQSGMTEAKSGRCIMSDVSTTTLDLMLEYIYENSTEFLDDTTTNKDVLIAADKYQMADLKEVCEKLLVVDITNESAADLLILADRVSAAILKTAALDHIVRNLRAMTSSGLLKNLSEGGDSVLIQEAFAAVAQHGEDVDETAPKVSGKSKKRKTSD